MSYKTQEFIFNVDDFQYGVPIGYEVEFSLKSSFSTILYKISTFEEPEGEFQGTFFYSLDDGETWVNYPVGEQGKTFTSAYKMKVLINSSNINYLFAEKGGTVYKIRSDIKEIIDSYEIDITSSGISVDSKNNLYVYGDNKTLYKIDTKDQLKPADYSINILADPLGIVIDDARRTFWQIDGDKVNIKDMSGKLIFSKKIRYPILSNFKKVLNKFNGNICFSGLTSRGYCIYEVDYITKNIYCTRSSKIISDICLENSLSYLLSFSDNWIGQYSLGVINNEYFDSGISIVDSILINSSLDYYLLNRDLNKIYKYRLVSVVWTSIWESYLPDYSLRYSGNILMRESDDKVIYYNNENIYMVRGEDGLVSNGVEIAGDGDLHVSIGNEFLANCCYMRYRTVDGRELDQSSSSSSSSMSSGSSNSSSSSSSSSSGL